MDDLGGGGGEDGGGGMFFVFVLFLTFPHVESNRTDCFAGGDYD
jgi:hypothetical protein